MAPSRILTHRSVETDPPVPSQLLKDAPHAERTVLLVVLQVSGMGKSAEMTMNSLGPALVNLDLSATTWELSLIHI